MDEGEIGAMMRARMRLRARVRARMEVWTQACECTISQAQHLRAFRRSDETGLDTMPNVDHCFVPLQRCIHNHVGVHF